MILEHTIDGQELYFNFSDLSLRLFARKKGVSNIKTTNIAELLNDVSIDDMDLMFWCGLKEGGSKNGQPFTMSVEQFSEYLDDHADLYNELVQSMNEQSPEPLPAKDGEEGNQKPEKA